MLVKNIWAELSELVGSCDEAVVYSALAMGLEWLANEQLFDPLVGYLDFYVSDGYTVALPREVKSPIKININNNPSFTRSRLFEFTLNTDGSAEGEQLGWTFQHQGFACVQDERPLPAKLIYACDSESDNGATITIIGKVGGRAKRFTLTAANANSIASADIVQSIEHVTRSQTVGDCYLKTEGAVSLARYYPDEEEPEYKVIRLSKKAVAIRMMFRRHVPQEFKAQTDVIPFHSRLGIIHAAKTARLLQKGEYERAAISAEVARKFAMMEQKSRDEDLDMAGTMEISTARNYNLDTLDGLICADVYDEASVLFGPVGQRRLFDYISLARQILGAKALWDWTLGAVDIIKANTSDIVTPLGKGTGIFTLPRYVGTVLAIASNHCHGGLIPRNRWFEYHLNGTGEKRTADYGNWDEWGSSVTANDIPLHATTKIPIPHQLTAVSSSSLDVGARFRVYGMELNINGVEVEVFRDEERGYLCPVVAEINGAAVDSPLFTKIDDLQKDSTRGFVTLSGFPVGSSTGIMLGYYYPDDTKPRFRRIKVSFTKEHRVRILYKLREQVIRTLYDPLHLRSKAALIEMLRAMKMRDSDPAAADAMEATAVRYLAEQEMSDNPTDSVRLQVNRALTPGGFRNII